MLFWYLEWLKISSRNFRYRRYKWNLKMYKKSGTVKIILLGEQLAFVLHFLESRP